MVRITLITANLRSQDRKSQRHGPTQIPLKSRGIFSARHSLPAKAGELPCQHPCSFLELGRTFLETSCRLGSLAHSCHVPLKAIYQNWNRSIAVPRSLTACGMKYCSRYGSPSPWNCTVIFPVRTTTTLPLLQIINSQKTNTDTGVVSKRKEHLYIQLYLKESLFYFECFD